MWKLGKVLRFIVVDAISSTDKDGQIVLVIILKLEIDQDMMYFEIHLQ